LEADDGTLRKLCAEHELSRGNIHRTTCRAHYPNAVMMYITNHVNVLLANEIPFALCSTVSGVSQPGFRNARD
jgi:hypothetical protein